MAGKTSRDYYETETGMQIFEIIEIQVPPGYLGNINLFSGDIAVARLNAPIIYQTFIRPICIAYQKFAEKVRLNEILLRHADVKLLSIFRMFARGSQEELLAGVSMRIMKIARF